MFNLFNAIENNLTKPRPIKTDRIPTHMPSQSMCNSALDGKPIGTCLRSVYLGRMEYPVTNPLGVYTIMAGEAGRLWETWLINQYKELGIYLDHSVKLYDPTAFISGEIDIVHYNPETDAVELTECKQYNGSNYYAASELKGNLKTAPKPKDQHLLQSFDYLLMCRNTEQDIKYINLVYIDRSCGNYKNNVQFRVSLTEQKGSVYPRLEYFNADGSIEVYTDFRITEKGILNKNEMLDQKINAQQIPMRDYEYRYSDELIDDMVLKKEVSTIKLNKFKQDPIKNPIGDWQCRFCRFSYNLDGQSTCYSLGE